MNLPFELENIAKQIRAGTFTESSEAVLLTRDAKTGIITHCPWGEKTGLLAEAAELITGMVPAKGAALLVH